MFKKCLRFIYGRDADFKNHQLAVQLYLFAQEWRILHLMKALEDFVETIEPIFILETLASLGNEENPISSNCLKVSHFNKLPLNH